MRIKSVIVLLVWFAVVILIAPRVDTYSYAHSLPGKTSDTPVFLRMLGEARSIVSNLSLIQADVYFHGGVYDRGEACPGIHSEDEDLDHEEHLKPPEPSPYDILLRLSEETLITEHIHLKGDQLKQIVPWLYYAAELDPHNVKAYTLTGYYLIYRLNKPDQGMAFLKKGLANNPDSWEINAEIGREYFQVQKNYATSLRYFQRAKDLLDKTSHDKFQERYVLSYLALCYEKTGQLDKTLPLYKRLDEIFPDHKIFKDKIKELSAQ
ncbi:MAG: hypothetical protein WBD00_03300 [Candidatus Omnitrophota bacterium]